MKQWWVRIAEDTCSLHIALDIGYKVGDDTYHFRKGEFVKANKFKYIGMDEHSLLLPSGCSGSSNEIATAIIDGLIKYGFKPSIPIKNEPEIESVRYHLEDMRKLVFKK